MYCYGNVKNCHFSQESTLSADKNLQKLKSVKIAEKVIERGKPVEAKKQWIWYKDLYKNMTADEIPQDTVS